MRILALSGVALLAPACAAPPRPTFAPLSYRAELPRVSVYPALVMPGAVVIVLARPLATAAMTEACLRIDDAAGFAWLETCGDTTSRRVPFRPATIGRHVAFLYYPTADGPVYRRAERAEFCVLGENADCP